MFNFNLGYFLLDKYLPLYFCFCFSWLLYAAVVAAIPSALATITPTHSYIWLSSPVFGTFGFPGSVGVVGFVGFGSVGVFSYVFFVVASQPLFVQWYIISYPLDVTILVPSSHLCPGAGIS